MTPPGARARIEVREEDGATTVRAAVVPVIRDGSEPRPAPRALQ